MKTIKKIVAFSVAFILVCLIPAYAFEQGEPQETLSLKDIPFFEYDLKKKEGPKTYQLKLPVALETQGLKGPLPFDNKVAAYFWEKYKDAGMKWAIENGLSKEKDYQTPYMRIVAMQSVGTPVRIKLLAPKMEEIIMPLIGEEGKGSNLRYKIIKRSFQLRIIYRLGEMTLDREKEKIKLVENNDTLEISWIPSMVEKRRGPELAAPIVIEINLEYKVRMEAIIDGKYTGGSLQEGWVERRVVWIAMPVCGMEFGEDDEPIACPASVAKPPSWKEYDLGTVSIQVPDNWQSKVKDGNARFELGDELAGISVIRVKGGEKQVKYMKEVTEKNRKINGLDAVEYSGMVKKGKLKAKIILFKDKPSDGKEMGIATILKDDKYAPILAASLESVTIDNGKATVPGISTQPTPHIPELSDLGSGEYHYSPDNIVQQEYEPLPSSTPAKKEEDPATTQAPPEKQDTPAVQNAATVTLKRIKGFGDFVGRSETLQGDGSPDSQLELEIDAPEKTLIGLTLREKDTKQTIWDTINGNDTWLIAVTKKNKPVSQTDGTLQYTLGTGKEILNLWLQDNNVLAAGKKELELVLIFDNNKSLIIPVNR